MTGKNSPEFLGFAEMLQNWQETQRKFMPSGLIMSQMAEAVLTVSQAHLAYQQTVMRANAGLLAAIWKAAISIQPVHAEQGIKKDTH